MFHRRTALQLTALGCLSYTLRSTLCRAASPTDVFADGKAPADERLKPLKTLNDDFSLTPPKTKEAWERRRTRLREQLLVANGLWPMPEKCDLKPLVHSKADFDGYTRENVAIQSLPGHYVTGNLYRPKSEHNPDSVQHPAIPFAHGHWNDGRFHVESEAGAKAAVERGEEATVERARFFMQALPITLAKLGFVVFQYDMVGYADSQAIPHVARSGVPHGEGFADAEGELRLQSLMGLQTWNSIRALDFVCSLPTVDTKRLGMTGASGGGTQTFILAAIDDRLQVSCPAVMVSTAMQGGCVCENCSLLRVGTGNIELAGLFAPKAQALSGADDWTKEIMTKGYPELKQLYKLYDAADKITAKAWLRLPHNYGQPSREFMYQWFMKHLQGNGEAVTEEAFTPSKIDALRVFNAEHPRPKDELKAAGLRASMTKASDKQLSALKGRDPEHYRSMLQGALRAMLVDELPEEIAIRSGPLESKHDGITMHRAVLGRKDEKDAVPHAGVFGPKFDGSKVLLWADPLGKQALFSGDILAEPVRALVDAGYAVVAPDLLGYGELKLPMGYPVNQTFAGFTFGYNRCLLAQRVHDLLTTVAFAKQMGNKSVSILGVGEAGPVAILAKAAALPLDGWVIADRHGLDFAKITKTDDPFLLPGALKYGGLDAFVSLIPASQQHLVNADGKEAQSAEELVNWLLSQQ